jgi:hypothetical protein
MLLTSSEQSDVRFQSGGGLARSCSNRMFGRPLRGARGWLITDGKIGMVVQCRGVADALRLSYIQKDVSPTGLSRVLSPWTRPARSERFDAEGTALHRHGPTSPLLLGA